ncbi:hypothetical protein [Pseudomonas sp. RL_105y_Pfl2_101]|uniref:hypothetical protein n=1 Tax=Pseudomonas sp. RL_105y_Pfl2_101 TaxID=3088708 RepID=UPI0030D760FA
MNIPPYERELLFRKAQGNKLLEEFKKKINSIFLNGYREESRKSLPETDRIIEKLRSMQLTHCIERTYESLDECFNFITTQLAKKNFYALIDEDWKYCGAVLIEANTKLNNNFNFDESTSDEIRLIAADFSSQISVDHFQDSDSHLYECSIKEYATPEMALSTP